MKIKYTGIKNTRKKSLGGCGSCGRRFGTNGSSITTYAYTYKMVLPSGKRYVFRLNQIYDIEDSRDYAFLTSFTYDFNGHKESPFIAVTDGN